MMKLTIIGGGITGLAAAYYATQLAQSPIDIVVLEQANYWGGKLVTNRIPHDRGQFVIEAGPDTFVVTKPWGVKLCKELGIADRLLGTNPETKTTYILKDNHLHELPGGLTMMIPTEFSSMLRTGLLSWSAKARMGLDFFLPPAAQNGDETMGAFVSRRLGRAAYENLIEPLMSGIYAGDGDKLSVQSTLPYLRDLERDYGGLVKGALAIRRARIKKTGPNRNNGSHPDQAAPAPQGGTPGSRSIFLTPKTGLAEIVEALLAHLRATGGVKLCLNSTAQMILKTENGYQICLADGSSFDTDLLLLATPAYVSAALTKNISPRLSVELEAIEYVSTATVSLAYHTQDLPRPLDGYGYVIPRKEGRKALACTWTSTKFPHRAPSGYALLRVFIGRAGQEGEIGWDETGLLSIALDEIRQTLGITAQPILKRVFSWEKAMPQYNLGHPGRLERIDTAHRTLDGLALAGNGYLGIGIPDCIRSGEEAVRELFNHPE